MTSFVKSLLHLLAAAISMALVASTFFEVVFGGLGSISLGEIMVLFMIFLPLAMILAVAAWAIIQLLGGNILGLHAFFLMVAVTIAFSIVHQIAIGASLTGPLLLHPTLLALWAGALVFAGVCAIPPGVGGILTKRPFPISVPPFSAKIGIALGAILVVIAPALNDIAPILAALLIGLILIVFSALVLASSRRFPNART